MKFNLRIWRQASPTASGGFKDYAVDNISSDSSFLEMMDVLNDQLEERGEEPVAFDSDCREGICGTCGFMVNGRAHGGHKGATTCQLYMRDFTDGATIHCEPWRASAFPVLKDLVVDRSAFDRVLQKGGYVSVNTGQAPDANALPISKVNAEIAFDAAQCIGCGACVASCKNASAMLFVGAKVTHLSVLPQGAPERRDRAAKMVAQMDAEGFGNCTNEFECSAHCPKEIPVSVIGKLNREHMRARLFPKIL